jgi:hypothetical protein
MWLAQIHPGGRKGSFEEDEAGKMCLDAPAQFV